MPQEPFWLWINSIQIILKLFIHLSLSIHLYIPVDQWLNLDRPWSFGVEGRDEKLTALTGYLQFQRLWCQLMSFATSRSSCSSCSSCSSWSSSYSSSVCFSSFCIIHLSSKWHQCVSQWHSSAGGPWWRAMWCLGWPFAATSRVFLKHWMNPNMVTGSLICQETHTLGFLHHRFQHGGGGALHGDARKFKGWGAAQFRSFRSRWDMIEMSDCEWLSVLRDKMVGSSAVSCDVSVLTLSQFKKYGFGVCAVPGVPNMRFPKCFPDFPQLFCRRTNGRLMDKWHK